MRTLQEQLTEKGLAQPIKQVEAKKDTSVRKKREERLTDREWRELMGMNRDTYQRVGGAFRRR
ncbi:hypothetical protein [Sporosarcina sp. FSL W7-1283]|uniref:hypothetical protein n=1 Tax=Sporosarcina sp. FSL W7-1283 TaxID=2921560 RepID=UPI0030FAB265